MRPHYHLYDVFTARKPVAVSCYHQKLTRWKRCSIFLTASRVWCLLTHSYTFSIKSRHIAKSNLSNPTTILGRKGINKVTKTHNGFLQLNFSSIICTDSRLKTNAEFKFCLKRSYHLTSAHLWIWIPELVAGLATLKLKNIEFIHAVLVHVLSQNDKNELVMAARVCHKEREWFLQHITN